jgi:hypothetical protein
MNTYTYEIAHLYTTNTNTDRADDVFKILVVAVATNPSGQVNALNCMFNISPGESFTEFGQLTDQQVREWVDASPQWPYYQQQLDAMFIEQPVNELDIPKPLPWIPTHDPSTDTIQVQTVDTTSSNTATMIISDVLKAAVLQVLQEMEDARVQSSQDPA